jgi:hypothetical protein
MWLPGASQKEREPAERPTVYTSQMPGLPPASRAYGRWTCVLLLLLCGLAAQGAWAQCRIVTEKASVEDVAVEFSALSFSLDLKGVPATVELEETGKRPASIHVLAPLRFAASYPPEKLVYRIKRGVDLYRGRIHLGKQAGHTWLGVRGDGMQLSLQSALDLEVKEPVIVPCGSVKLGDGTPFAAPLAILPPPDHTVGTGTAFFPLYRTPREVDSLDIRYSGPFQVLRRRPGWVLLQAAWEDGSRVRGWTLERFTTSKISAPRAWGGGGSGERLCVASDGPRLARITLREHAPVASSPGGTIWASVARRITVDAFPLDRPDGWTRVAAVPGLPAKPCSAHEHIWVRARDVIGPVPRARGTK